MSKKSRLTVKPLERAAEDWLKEPEGWKQSYPPLKRDIYTARLTLDITPELHKRIKRAAMRRDRSLAMLLRELLEREYPNADRDDQPATEETPTGLRPQIAVGTPS